MPFAIESRYDPTYAWEPLGVYHVYETAREADELVRAQNTWYENCGHTARQRVKEVSLDEPIAYRFREKARLLDGTYQVPIWGYSEPFYEHMDPAKPTMVRFIRDEKDGLRNRYTSMTVGRFLSRFRDFPQDKIEEFCARVGLDMEVSKLQVGSTPDDFENIYLNGPHSCMAYEAREGRYGEEDSHPVRLYGDLDLAVAYITRADEITARTLVWPEKKIHGRIYGDSKRLKLRLAEEGYTENWDFSGARLHLDRNGYNEIRAPYVDGDLNGTVSDCGKYIVLSRTDGNLVLESDGGTIYTDHCYECGTKESRLDWSDYFDGYVCATCEEHRKSDEYEEE